MFLVLYGMSVTLISFLISVERKKKNSVKLGSTKDLCCKTSGCFEWLICTCVATQCETHSQVHSVSSSL